jgi:hypothetical protein
MEIEWAFPWKCRLSHFLKPNSQKCFKWRSNKRWHKSNSKVQWKLINNEACLLCKKYTLRLLNHRCLKRKIKMCLKKTKASIIIMGNKNIIMSIFHKFHKVYSITIYRLSKVAAKIKINHRYLVNWWKKWTEEAKSIRELI